MKTFLLRMAYRLVHVKWWLFRPVTMGVRVLLVDGDRILLVYHTYQDDWHFPGGALERGESVAEAAAREAREEAGAHFLEPPTLLGVYSSFYSGKTDHVVTFVCRNFHLGEREDRWEIQECAFFPFDNLPTDLSPGSDRRIQEYFEGRGPYARPW